MHNLPSRACARLRVLQLRETRRPVGWHRHDQTLIKEPWGNATAWHIGEQLA